MQNYAYMVNAKREEKVAYGTEDHIQKKSVCAAGPPSAHFPEGAAAGRLICG